MRTFVDTGVLIASARGLGQDPMQSSAFLIMNDPEREFISSDIVRLELMPKPLYHQRDYDVSIYLSFFAIVVDWVRCTTELADHAYELACQYGLGACDSFHIAAALSANADQFVTTERETKPIFRVPDLTIVSLFSSRASSDRNDRGSDS